MKKASENDILTNRFCEHCSIRSYLQLSYDAACKQSHKYVSQSYHATCQDCHSSELHKI
jgi:hypothetical protein